MVRSRPPAERALQPRHRDELMTVASAATRGLSLAMPESDEAATSRYIDRGADVHLIDMRDDAETVSTHRESKRIAPYEVSGRELDRRKARRSGIALTTSSWVHIWGRQGLLPRGSGCRTVETSTRLAFLVMCSVKLLVEAMPRPDGSSTKSSAL